MTSRESIWSVPQSWRELYFVAFSIQFIVCTGFIAWYETFVNAGDSAYETFAATGRVAAPFVVLIAAETIILVEVLFMISERYLRKRYMQGQTDTHKQWEAWNNRRLAAEAEGRPFDEPPPSPPSRANAQD